MQKNVLILSFIVVSIQKLFAGDAQENIANIQINSLPAFAGKVLDNDGKLTLLPLSNKQYNLSNYFCMFSSCKENNDHQADLYNPSRASNISTLSNNSIGLNFDNLNLNTPTIQSPGLLPESGYTSPIKGSSDNAIGSNTFSPGDQKFSSPNTARERAILFGASIVQTSNSKRKPKRERSDSFDENDRKTRKH